MDKVIVESVPNFSVARDTNVVEGIAKTMQSIDGVKLLHLDVGIDANRTVFTLAGHPHKVCEALFQATKFAIAHIDMQLHQGNHPRIGALDVCPLIPISGITISELLVYAEQLGARLGKELNIPVYFYESSAKSSQRKNLAYIRRGEYEGLEEKMKQKEWLPDNGISFNSRTGATVLGVRNFLLAYNVNLETKETMVAKAIAATIRASGYTEFQNGQAVHHPGSLKGVKAIGWYVEEFQCSQVSTNITNIEENSIASVFNACKAEAKKFGVSVNSSELIGLIPKKAVDDAANHLGIITTNEKDKWDMVSQALGLNIKESFDFQQRIIENLL